MVLSDEVIARRLRAVDQSSESIQTTSMWIMHHRDSINLIVACWSEVFKTADDPLQIALFYVANDACQKAKKRADSHILLQAFAPHWINAIAYSRSSEIVQRAVNRILDIFEERQIYSKSQLADMRAAQSDANELEDNTLLDFDIAFLVHDIEGYHKGNLVMERARELLARSDFNFKDKIKSRMKDRRDGEKFMSEIEQSYTKLTDFLEALAKHRKRGQALLEEIENAKRCFSLQLRDVTVVEDAYQKFGAGIYTVRSELEEMLKTGVYPGASPPRDAPSPTANEDPFREGVEEAFVQMRRPRENTEVTDMDVEKDDDVITADSLKTNQSFTGSSHVLNMIDGIQGVERTRTQHHSSSVVTDPRLTSSMHHQAVSTSAVTIAQSASSVATLSSAPTFVRCSTTSSSPRAPSALPQHPLPTQRPPSIPPASQNTASMPPWLLGPPPNYMGGPQAVLTTSLITPLVSSQPHRIASSNTQQQQQAATSAISSNPSTIMPPPAPNTHTFSHEMIGPSTAGFYPPSAPPPPPPPFSGTPPAFAPQQRSGSFNIPPPPSTPANNFASPPVVPPPNYPIPPLGSPGAQNIPMHANYSAPPPSSNRIEHSSTSTSPSSSAPSSGPIKIGNEQRRSISTTDERHHEKARNGGGKPIERRDSTSSGTVALPSRDIASRHQYSSENRSRELQRFHTDGHQQQQQQHTSDRGGRYQPRSNYPRFDTTSQQR